MLSRFAFRKRAVLELEAIALKKERQPIALHSDDFLCPYSIELEDDVTSIKTNTDSTKALSNEDALSSKSEPAAAPIIAMHNAQQETCYRTVPEKPQSMTILQFVDQVTMMRPRDVHSPVNATLDVYITQLGPSVHSFKLMCPSCHQNKYKRYGGEGVKCATCRAFSDKHQVEQEIMFSIGIMDCTGELYDLKVSGSAALELLNSQGSIECHASNVSSLRNSLLFSQSIFEVKAMWNESLKRPVVEIVSASLVRT